MFDIDYFKQINDTYGHPTGDVVLKTLVQKIRRSIRESDILFRWGGEEFLIILPESDVNIASNLAEKIRKTVEDLEITFSGKTISVTISMGVGTMSEVDTSDDLIMRSDKALYAAKEKGRNRVERCD
jgi:diguanylate cyclase (GGDEF)-like protein